MLCLSVKARYGGLILVKKFTQKYLKKYEKIAGKKKKKKKCVTNSEKDEVLFFFLKKKKTPNCNEESLLF